MKSEARTGKNGKNKARTGKNSKNGARTGKNMKSQAALAMNRVVQHSPVAARFQNIELFVPENDVGVSFTVSGVVSPIASIGGHLDPGGGGSPIGGNVAQDEGAFDLSFTDVPAGTYTLWAYGVGAPPQPSDNCQIRVVAN
jgi:hypothetical protein